MSEKPPVYEFEGFRLDPATHSLSREGAEVALPPKLYDLLLVLLRARDQTLEKERLLAEVWPDAVVEEGSLTRSVSRLRTLLGDGEERIIKTVARRGYRFVASVQELPGGEAAAKAGPDPLPEPAPPPVSAAELPPPARRVWAPAVLLLLVLGLTFAAGIGLTRRSAAVPRGRALAVLPFRAPDRDPSATALGLGVADSLITQLANGSAVAVRPTSAIDRYAGSEIDSVVAGRELDVDVVLEGTLRRVEDRIRVTARLVDVDRGTPLWGSTFDETSSSLLDLEDRLARRLAGALSVALASPGAGQRGTTVSEAYEEYLRGRFLSFRLTPDAFSRSRAHLERALLLDPKFARAWATLAFLHVNTVDLVAPPREAWPAARRALQQALALDPELASAHMALGLVHWQYDWDWPAAEASFRRAVELDPTDAVARSFLAFFLGSQGRSEEAIAEAERSRTLDPLAVDVGTSVAMVYCWARRPAQAEERALRVTSLDSSHWLARVILGRAQEGEGRLPDAVATYEAAARLEGAVPEALMDLGRGYAKVGRRAEAEKVVRDLTEFGGRRHPVPFQLAVVFAALGERERALAELERAYEARSWYLTWLAVDPALDPLRGDPRFGDLLRRVGFR